MMLGNNLGTWAAGAVLAALLGTMIGMALDRIDLRAKLDKAEARVIELDLAVASRDATIATLNANKIDGEEIARVSAKACQSTIKFQMRAAAEAQEIHNASDDAAAARAYDRLLCQRPEAAGHPACATAAPAGE